MAKYFILGPSASVFWDPTSRLKVVSTDPENPDCLVGNVNKRIEAALKQNHIQEVKGFKPKPKADEEETEEVVVQPKKAEKKKESNLSKMTKDQLISYYKENYEVTEDDVKNFSAMKPKAMVEFLEDEDQAS